MQRIFLIRDGITSEGGISGRLIFGDQVLYTLEPNKDKPFHEGHPCIPAGKYIVELSMSARFKRILPILLDVPGREGIRFHSGDTVKDTHGCILLFSKLWPIGRGTSRKSESAFVKWLSDMAVSKEKVELTILET